MTEQYDLSKGELEVRTSENIGAEFYSAYVRAQGEIGPALATKTNTYHGKKYADLSDVWEAIRPHFKENGLAVIQFPFTRTGTIERSYREEENINGRKVARPQYFDDGQPMMETVPVIYVRVRTRIVHESGQWLEQDLEIPVAMGSNPAQAVGIATTYARRYALMAISGVAPDEDDGQSLTEPEFQNLGRPHQPVSAGPRKTNKPAGPTRPQGKQNRLDTLCDRLRQSENLTTLRALYESGVRELESNGSEEDLATLEGVKDEVKAQLSEQMPKDTPTELPDQEQEPEQETSNQPARGVKTGRKSAGDRINF